MDFTVTGWHQWHWEARDARKGFDNGDIEQLLLLTGDVQCPPKLQFQHKAPCNGGWPAADKTGGEKAS